MYQIIIWTNIGPVHMHNKLLVGIVDADALVLKHQDITNSAPTILTLGLLCHIHFTRNFKTLR